MTRLDYNRVSHKLLFRTNKQLTNLSVDDIIKYNLLWNGI